MANEIKAIDYQAMIADLKAKRASIDAAITNLIAASGAMIPTGDTGSASSYQMPSGIDSQPIELPRGAFLSKSLPAAIKLYLSAMKRKQSIREIATALREGGVESTSDNFEGVITGCLNRMKANGEILRFNDGWALAEFYPENLRSRLSQQAAPKRKTAKKKGKKANKGANAPKETKESAPSTPGVAQRIETFVNERQDVWFTLADLYAVLPGDPKSVVALMLGKLAKRYGWEKSSDGKYRAGNVQPMPKAI